MPAVEFKHNYKFSKEIIKGLEEIPRKALREALPDVESLFKTLENRAKGNLRSNGSVYSGALLNSVSSKAELSKSKYKGGAMSWRLFAIVGIAANWGYKRLQKRASKRAGEVVKKKIYAYQYANKIEAKAPFLRPAVVGGAREFKKILVEAMEKTR